METDLIQGIAISMMVATVLAYLAYRLRQPLILGYILAGIIIGPELGFGFVEDHDVIESLSELGLIMLLFIIGLEIDLKKLLQSGRAIVIIGITQFIFCIALGFAFFNLPGFDDGGDYATHYLAAAFALSSTMLVVKILYDKLEFDTLPGRITLGLLVIQDLWVVVLLAIQPNLDNPEVGGLVGSFLKGAALVAGCLLVSRFILPYIFRSIAKTTELMLVAALGWCFLVSYLSGDVADLSREIGALIAGVSLAAFPYNPEITARIINIRDFFLTLFFVTLGMKVAEPTLDIFLWSLLASLFLIASRFATIFPVLYLQKKGIRVSFLVPLNITQISEFSLVIVALGIGYNHVNENVLTIILFTLMITFTLSTYMISYSHHLYKLVHPVLIKLGFKDIGADEEEEAQRPILFLGFYKVASSLLHSLEKHDSPLKDQIAVVDFNPEAHRELINRGIPCTYGDLGNPDTLLHCGLDKIRMVVSTIPDHILKGTSNMDLLRITKRVNPTAKVVVTAESISMAQKLYESGADYVLLPRLEAAGKLASLLIELINQESPDICIEERSQILAHPGEIINR
ncbi:cation:proton antiporter [Chloroflexota bacterium]